MHFLIGFLIVIVILAIPALRNVALILIGIVGVKATGDARQICGNFENAELIGGTYTRAAGCFWFSRRSKKVKGAN